MLVSVFKLGCWLVGVRAEVGGVMVGAFILGCWLVGVRAEVRWGDGWCVYTSVLR